METMTFNSSVLSNKCICYMNIIRIVTIPVLRRSRVGPSACIDFALKHAWTGVNGDAFVAIHVIKNSPCSETLAN